MGEEGHDVGEEIEGCNATLKTSWEISKLAHCIALVELLVLGFKDDPNSCISF